MKTITVIAKVTSSCNLRCPYCYTRHTVEKPLEIMQLKTFEKIIQSIALEYDELNLIFHGGEPLLVPIEWYKDALNIIKKYQNLFDFKVRLAMQSNITLMNEEYDKLFNENKINVGFSYDGLTNDRTRKNTKLIINNNKLYSSIKGCICLITKDNFDNIENEIDHFNELEVDVKFNVVFNTKTGVENNLTEMTKEDLLNCYKRIFEYLIKKEKSMAESTFDIYLKKINNQNANLVCTNVVCIERWISVHSDGSTYPCGQEWDNYPDYTYDNINNKTISEIFESEKAINFKNKFQAKIDKCKKMNCKVFSICNGSCPGENKANGKDIDSYVEEHCYLMKGIYDYLLDFINDEEKVKTIKNTHILNILNSKGVSNYECSTCR